MIAYYAIRNTTYQTFPDHPDATSRPHIYYGSWYELRDRLHAENDSGMGIFYAVNFMMPWMRKVSSIVYISGHYVDIDGIPNDFQKDVAAEQLLLSDCPPTNIVYTRNGIQATWRTPVTPIDMVDLDKYRETQEGLIKTWNGDPGAKDAARVLRVPGTLHQKNPEDPYLCTLMYEDDEAFYTVTDLHKRYALPKAPGVHTRVMEYSPATVNGTREEWEDLMRSYGRWRGVEGVRHKSLLIAAGNAVRCGVSERKAVHDLFAAFSRFRDDERTAMTEVLNAVRFAYHRGEPYTARALTNLINSF